MTIDHEFEGRNGATHNGQAFVEKMRPKHLLKSAERGLQEADAASSFGPLPDVPSKKYGKVSKSLHRIKSRMKGTLRHLNGSVAHSESNGGNMDETNLSLLEELKNDQQLLDPKIRRLQQLTGTKRRVKNILQGTNGDGHNGTLQQSA